MIDNCRDKYPSHLFLSLVETRTLSVYIYILYSTDMTAHATPLKKRRRMGPHTCLDPTTEAHQASVLQTEPRSLSYL